MQIIDKIKEKPLLYGSAALGFALATGLLYKQFNKSPVSNNKLWPNTIDKQSQSNLDELTTLHHDLDIKIDFKNKQLIGKVTYTFKSKINGLNKILLDVNNLQIISACEENKVISYNVVQPAKHSQVLGDYIVLNLNSKKKRDQEFKIIIEYKTNNQLQEGTAVALNWLNPEQTIGKEHPYLFTQCQAIFCRSLFPCQDSPSVKATFNAKLSVNRHLSAWCSGILTKNVYNKANDMSSYFFEQNTPIPSYLFSIVAGNLEKRQVGNRCSVITEPEFIDECEVELENMENYLIELENYITDYSWGEYKIVVLPPSFPYGGMENPTLTFVNPTIIVGDKSNVDVVIHEMAHSWSGNLVSCKNWEHFWLNEGMTMFLENKINQKLNGEGVQKVHQVLQDIDLKKDIDEYKEAGEKFFQNYTALIPNLGHDNPDDAFSSIPYMKGQQFLTYLESLLGEEIWNNFIKKYFTHFKNLSIDTDQFLDFFKKFVYEKFDKENANKIWNQIDFKTWLYTAGYPPQVHDYKSDLIEQAKLLGQEFILNDKLFQQDQEKLNKYQQFSVQLKCIFYNEIYQKVDQLNAENVGNLDRSLELLAGEANCEILIEIILIGIAVKYQPVLDRLPKFLSSVGRMKFCRPTYKELAKNSKKYPEYVELSKKLYDQNKDFYHVIASKMIAQDIKIKE
ncbi:Armadillo-type fold [Pseudocohnilembus persalinus]|uniref:Armadillo-type fold n=1 Tax=Pseudocohnilembus persalinus TaxID=266149 RepID=A0A0V0R2R1_PSEPJ|nr:Armadillo-type fold [Pseudocohnilembus persalinus]|eukprot:KRX08812.1 Armadillo-type fold [Pseudocohnilembus persalinus]